MDNKALFIVGVSQRVDIHEQINESRDAVDQRLLSWIIAAGFLPVPIPNVLLEDADDYNVASESGNKLRDWLELVKPQGLILSGGNDIGQRPERDYTERYLINWSMDHHIPLLGICRGLQMIASNAGSDLVKVDGHVRTRHNLKFMSEDQNLPATVNSFHNWTPRSCPADFNIMAVSEDGSIEAIKHQILPLEGWMWHPERENPFNDIDTQRLRRLFCGR